VSLGDSYISGEGGPLQGNSNDVHRSRSRTDPACTGSGYDEHAVRGASAANGCSLSPKRTRARGGGRGAGVEAERATCSSTFHRQLVARGP